MYRTTRGRARMQHEQFQALLDRLVKLSGVGQEVLGEVLTRTAVRAPQETSRTEIQPAILLPADPSTNAQYPRAPSVRQ